MRLNVNRIDKQLNPRGNSDDESKEFKSMREESRLELKKLPEGRIICPYKRCLIISIEECKAL